MNNIMDFLARKINAVSRSISSENTTGAKGQGARMSLEQGVAGSCARDLGVGWKVNPFVSLKPSARTIIADIKGPGSISHIWVAATGKWRNQILRIYWDGQKHPSVECPLGDFFACGWNQYAQVSSLAVCVNPGSGLNCYWQMPFNKRCVIEVENISPDETYNLYYQIDYFETPPQGDVVYFHAKFNRTNPLPYMQDYIILDNVSGAGHYVGTYMCWGTNNNGWWGEGEIKFFMDGDREFPTICGTGTEDYFCGAYAFEIPGTRRYQEYTTPYAGFVQIIKGDGFNVTQQRFGLYRWHITDPVIFTTDLKVTMQALGWREGGRYLPLQDDLASVAYWYQTLPSTPFGKFFGKDYLEII